MDLEGIKPREISQGQTNTAVFQSYVESKKQKLTDAETRLALTRGEGGLGRERKG